MTTNVFLKITLVAMALSLFSCESKSPLETMKQDLEKKKLELSNLKVEIKTLQDQIDALDTSELKTGVAVTVQEIQPDRFQHYFNANGSFEAIKYAYISPETSGQVKSISVKEGDRVSRGQELARLNTAIIENSINEVKTALQLATTVYQKQKELWEKKIGSEIEFLRSETDMQRLQDQLKTLNSQLDMSIIKSPIDGMIDMIAVKRGELAMPGQMLMQIVNMDEFKLNVDIAETYLPFLHQGDTVTVNLMAYTDKNISAQITRIANIINPENRSFKVEIKVDNKEGLIRPNMLAEVRFMDYENPQTMVVPSIIVKNDFKGSYLFIAVNNEKNEAVSKKVYIKTGRSVGDITMVESGLNIGDKVIVKGYSQVVDGTFISIK